jgi:antitoxin MazE
MQTKIQKWGNSLGLRIPKSFAAQARVEAGSTVDLSLEDGDLVVKPIRRKKYDLNDLLRGINSRNLHREIESGEPVGTEAW